LAANVAGQPIQV